MLVGSAILKLAAIVRLWDRSICFLFPRAEGGIARIIVDTKNFRGNIPKSVAVEACCRGGGGDDKDCQRLLLINPLLLLPCRD